MTTFDQALNKIEQGILAPVYLLSGNEQYLIDKMCQAIERQVLGTHGDDFNRVFFDLEQTPIEDVIFEASSLSFFGDQKLVIADHAYFLSAKKPRGVVDHQLDILSDYLESPSPDSVLVLIAPYEKLDGRKKITKEVKKQAVHVDMTELKGYQASQIVQKYLHEQGFQISRDAWILFEQLTGQNLTKMMTEMDKLMLFHYDNRQIEKETVSELVPKNLEQNVFELNDLVLQLKVSEAMQMYQDLRAQKREPIAIIALLINEFRLLLQTKILSQKGYSQDAISKTLSVHPYRVKLALGKIRPFSQKLLAEALKYLIQSDYEMKTGKVDHELVFELFVMRLNSLARRN